MLLTTIAATSLLACAERAVIYRFQRWSAGRHPRSTLLIGAGPVVQQVADVLYAHPEYGMRPVGVVHPYDTPGTDSPLPVLGSVGDIHRAIIQNSVRYAVFAGPRRAIRRPRTWSGCSPPAAAVCGRSRRGPAPGPPGGRRPAICGASPAPASTRTRAPAPA